MPRDRRRVGLDRLSGPRSEQLAPLRIADPGDQVQRLHLTVERHRGGVGWRRIRRWAGSMAMADRNAEPPWKHPVAAGTAGHSADVHDRAGAVRAAIHRGDRAGHRSGVGAIPPGNCVPSQGHSCSRLRSRCTAGWRGRRRRRPGSGPAQRQRYRRHLRRSAQCRFCPLTENGVRTSAGSLGLVGAVAMAGVASTPTRLRMPVGNSAVSRAVRRVAVMSRVKTHVSTLNTSCACFVTFRVRMASRVSDR